MYSVETNVGINPNREAAARGFHAALRFRFIPSSLPGVIDAHQGLSPCSFAPRQALCKQPSTPTLCRTQLLQSILAEV